MDELLDRFLAKAPVAVMVRACLAHALSDAALDDLFGRAARRQYTRELTFSALVALFTKVTFGAEPSLHAACRAAADLPVSVTAVYDKLARLEPGVSEALVRETARALAAIAAALPGPPPSPAIAGLRLRTLDGNALAGTDRRLACLRGSGAAALPGLSLVVRDGATGLLTDLVPCEDAYTSERALVGRVLDLAGPGELWLADRNFCTHDYLRGFAERGARFLVRHHKGLALEEAGPERYVGGNATVDVHERPVRVGPLACRCVTVKLHAPLRDGSPELRLLTDVPAGEAGAKRLAEVYRTRWEIEAAFQDLTVALRCEVSPLGYPRAALLAFALAVVAYDVLVVIRAALAAGRGAGAGEVSSYHLANEVAAASEGLAIAVPAEAWARFGGMGAAEFAAWLLRAAEGLRWERYRKSPRGPKKPRAVERTRRGAHRSTARELLAGRRGESP